jgi:hypothetical protein
MFIVLQAMLSEAGNSLEENELASIAVKIAKLDKRLAEQFERGPKLLERRAAAAAKALLLIRMQSWLGFDRSSTNMSSNSATRRYAIPVAPVRGPNAIGRRVSLNIRY